MSLFETIHQWGRTCLQCGYFMVGPSLFCQCCQKNLEENRQAKKFALSYQGRLLQGYTHFTWIPNRHRALSLLIESLKGGSLQKAWAFWSQKVLQGLAEGYSEKEFRQNAVLIPAPSSCWPKPDHAFAFAQQIQQSAGWELKNCLRKASKAEVTAQKKLSKVGRQSLRMSADEKISDDRAVIFVDDVITTGATAKAAYLALGQPKNFFILALAYRQSAEPQSFGCERE